MSVTRYRDIGAMPPVSRATGEELPRRIRATWARARMLVRDDPAFPCGVQKFASLEEAQAAREQATLARIERLRAVSDQVTPAEASPRGDLSGES